MGGEGCEHLLTNMQKMDHFIPLPDHLHLLSFPLILPRLDTCQHRFTSEGRLMGPEQGQSLSLWQRMQEHLDEAGGTADLGGTSPGRRGRSPGQPATTVHDPCRRSVLGGGAARWGEVVTAPSFPWDKVADPVQP